MGKYQCHLCPRSFGDALARRQHVKVKHKGKIAKPRRTEDDDESFAERAVQAEIDRACGIDSPDIDWLLP